MNERKLLLRFRCYKIYVGCQWIKNSFSLTIPSCSCLWISYTYDLMKIWSANTYNHIWGTSSDGRALALHVRGTGIDAPVLQILSPSESAIHLKNGVLKWNWTIQTDWGTVSKLMFIQRSQASVSCVCSCGSRWQYQEDLCRCYLSNSIHLIYHEIWKKRWTCLTYQTVVLIESHCIPYVGRDQTLDPLITSTAC